MSQLQKHLSEKPLWYQKAAEDHRLSYMGIGVLVNLLAQKQGWEVTLPNLGRGEDPAAVKAACQELMDAGFVTREETKRGKLITHVSNVADGRWVKRNAAGDFSTAPPSPKPVTYDDRSISDGTAETASEVELASGGNVIPFTATPGTGAQAVGGRVLRAWAEAVRKDPSGVRLNGERKRKVEARMSEGYTEEDMIEAVRGVALSPWHMGENPEGRLYNDMELVLRNGKNLEKFRELFRSGGEKRRSAVDQAMDMLGLKGDR